MTISPLYVGDWDDLGINEITSLYLYGTLETPDNYGRRMRTLDERLQMPLNSDGDRVLPIQIEMDSFMLNGPGRYAYASEATIVQRFFSGDLALSDGSYDLEDLKSIFGNSIEQQFHFTLTQMDIDTSSTDYMLRTYIYNNGGFTISKDAVFVVDGSDLYIEGLGIHAFNDNFDFSSGQWGVDIGDVFLKQNIDPYAIGATVEIQFVNKGNVPTWEELYSVPYGISDYNDDVLSAALRPDGGLDQGYADALSAMGDVVDQLEVNEVIRYETSNGEVIYGSNGNDNITGTSGKDIIITGEGNDTVSAGDDDDIIYVGTGAKSINGGDGSDTINLSNYMHLGDYKVLSVDLRSDRLYTSKTITHIDSIENFVGSSYDPTLLNQVFEHLGGNSQDNIFDGRGGNDSVVFDDLGASSDTVVWGGEGGSTLARMDNTDVIQLRDYYCTDVAGFYSYGFTLFQIVLHFTPQTNDWGGFFNPINENAYLKLQIRDLDFDGILDSFELPLVKDPDGNIVSFLSSLQPASMIPANGHGGWGGDWGGIRSSDPAINNPGYTPPPVAEKPAIPPLFIHPIAETYSPLIIDLDDDGLELTNLSSGAVYWDVDNDGMREASAWVQSDDALLVMDWNGNGYIDNHSELFGTKTIDGFTKLAELDSNSDGVIDENDVEFNNLQIWRDLNQDAISQENELLSLEEAGIVSINLAANPMYDLVEGNEVTFISSVTMADTSVRDIYDAWFEVDNQNTVFDGNIMLNPEVYWLPHLRGYGEVKDIDIQMTLDEVLLYQYKDLSDMDLEDVLNPSLNFDDGFKAMLYQWSGQSLIQLQNGVYSQYEDSRKVGFVQDIAGQEINPEAWLAIYQALFFRDEGLWEKLVTHYMGNFLFQTVLKELFEGTPDYDVYAGVITGATGLSSTALNDIATLIDATNDPAYGWSLVVRTVEEAIGIENLDTGDYDLLDDAIQNSDPSLSLDAIYDLVLGVPNDVAGTSGNDNITGTFADDQLDGLSGNDVLDGGRGDDHLFGQYGDDTYIGGTGDDILDEGSGNGNDVYVYDRGNDIIQNETSGTDTITLADGIVSGDITIERFDAFSQSSLLNSQTDLAIYIAGYGSITISQQYGYYGNVQGVETLQFDDLSTIDLTALDAWQYGTSGNDTLSGQDVSYYTRDMIDAGYGDDILEGGLGNDVLHGGFGDDTYLVGAGIDLIYDMNGTDEIVFDSSYDEELFTFKYDSTMNPYEMSKYALEIYYNGELKVVIDQQFANETYFIEKLVIDGVQEIDLASLNWDITGTSGADTLYAMTINGINSAVYGMGGNDSITGTYNDDVIYGGDGDDYIHGGYGGNDIIYGGDGNDIINASYGGYGSATIYGGAGSDTLTGGYDADTFVFEVDSAFSGVDTIADFSTAQGDVLHIADLLDGYYTPGVSDINDFVSISVSGSSSLLYVDRDGTGSSYTSQQIATLEYNTSLDVDTLLLNNNLIAA